MKSYFVKFSFLTTATLLAIAYAPGTLCKEEKQKESKPHVDDVDSWEDIFADMHNNVEKMHQRLAEDVKSATKHMRAAFDQATMPSLSMEENENALIIKMNDVSDQNIEATTHDNERLTIKTPEVSLELAVHDNVLHAQIMREQKEKEEKEGATKAFASVGYAETMHTITHSLELDNTKVQFDENTKTLVITIPYLPEKTGKKLAVEKVTKPQPATEKTAPGTEK